MTDRTRRSVLTAAGALSALSITGCIGQGDDSRTEPEPTPTPTPTVTPTETATATEEPEDDELAHLPGETVDDFEDLDGWVAMVDRGTLEPEEDDVYAGSRSALLAADEDTENVAIFRTFPQGIDLSGKNLSLAVRFTGREQLRLTVQLLAPNSRNVLSLRRVLTGPTDRWVRVDLGTNHVDTQPDLADVREIRVVGRRRGDPEGSLEFAIDDLRAVDRPEQGHVLLLFDGTLESHYTNAFDVMEEYGYAGVEAVIPETVGRDGRLTLDRMHEMNDAGWDMAARPRTGASFMHEYSVEEQEGMVRRTQAYLANRGFEDGAKHFVTPRNVLGPESMDIVREYHEQAFRFGGAPNALPITDPHNLGTFSGRDGEDTKHFVDLAAQYNQLAVLHFEEIGEDGLPIDEFRDLLDFIEERDVRVITATELLEL